MKNLLLITILATLSGCASTKLTVETPKARVSFSYPKNLKAESIEIKIGEYSLEAKGLNSDPSAPIDAQLKALSNLQSLAPLIR